MLKDLFDIIESRKASMPTDSYTADMFRKGEDEILKKIGEEAVEVILASKGQGDARLIEEVSDLIYHIRILLSALGLTLQEVEYGLRRRHELAQTGAEG